MKLRRTEEKKERKEGRGGEERRGMKLASCWQCMLTNILLVEV